MLLAFISALLFVTLVCASGYIAHVLLDLILPHEFPLSAKRVGGLTFVRVGRLSLSYSIRSA